MENETLFYFDRLWIYSMRTPPQINQNIPLNRFIEHCRVFKIKGKSSFQQFTNYHSWLDVIAPTPEFLRLLYQHEESLNPYKISYIELARDTIHDTKQQACEAIQNLHFRKKWATKHFTFYDSELSTNNEMFGNITKYSQSKNFGFKTYARISKIAGKPCAHLEWNIRTPKIIEAKTGISEIGDLLAFNFQKFFEITDNRMLIRNEKIDQQKLGKFLLGLRKKKKLNRRQTFSVGCHGSAYMNGRDYGDLVRYFSKLKKQIRSKTGPRTEWENRIIGLKDYSIFRKR